MCVLFSLHSKHPRTCGAKIDSVYDPVILVYISSPHGGTLPHACSFNHSPPCSSYSALVTREAFPSSVPLHSAMPLHASRRGSPPSSEDTILRGARNGRTGVRVFRSLGIRLGTLAPPPVTKMHWDHQNRFGNLDGRGGIVETAQLTCIILLLTSSSNPFSTQPATSPSPAQS